MKKWKMQKIREKINEPVEFKAIADNGRVWAFKIVGGSFGTARFMHATSAEEDGAGKTNNEFSDDGQRQQSPRGLVLEQ